MPDIPDIIPESYDEFVLKYREELAKGEMVWKALFDLAMQVRDVRHNTANLSTALDAQNYRLFGYDNADPYGGALGGIKRAIDATEQDRTRATAAAQAAEAQAKRNAAEAERNRLENRRWLVGVTLSCLAILAAIIVPLIVHNVA